MKKYGVLIVFLPLVFLYQNCGESFQSLTAKNIDGVLVSPSTITEGRDSSDVDKSPATVVDDELIDDPVVQPEPIVQDPTTILMKSVSAYEESLYKTLNNNSCRFCHETNKYPFLKGNSIDSHNYMIDNTIIDFNTATRSLIYTKAASGHQGTTPQVAEEILQNIKDWTDKRK